MYYWVILLFSMVTIMTYKLSTSEDKFNDNVVPLIESSIIGFVKQHEAALEYTKKENYTYTDPGDSLEETLYEKYLPSGHQINEDYITQIYCLDTSITDQNAVADCTTPNSLNFLITYTDVPKKWENDIVYFNTALGRYTERKDNVGIVETQELTDIPTASGIVRNSSWVINSVKGKNVYIPRMFACMDISADKHPVGKMVYITQLNYLDDTSKFINVSGEGCNFTPTAP